MMNRLIRFLPFLNWLSELKNFATLRADFVAGLTVALVIVPQSMAYAQLAGLPAEQGICIFLASDDCCLIGIF